MSKWTKAAEPVGERQPERWEKLLALPGNTELFDRSTGKTHRVEHLSPFRQPRTDFVFDFINNKTGEIVAVDFLRVAGDGIRCSLMKNQ
jgi:hypothetical protein